MFVSIPAVIVIAGIAVVLFLLLGVLYIRARKSDAAKTEFLSVAAHHIRTPLTLIKWTLAEFLEGNYGSFTDEQKNIFQNLVLRNEQLVRFVYSLLDVTRIEKKSTVLHPQNVSMSAFLNDVFSRLEPLATKREIQFSKEIMPDMPECRIDPEALSRVFENVVENAVIYNKPNGSVRVQGVIEGKDVVVRVQDTGIGISKNGLSRIGTKFFRAENAKKQSTQGTGLGVFTAREILKMQNGSISYESAESEGTTVTIRLPRAGTSK